ncbi:MAG TPA: GGDEF domain-containing protein [Pyrinomonadaceae bacterium]|jgi:diguanylate cyclase (GGDEF)-like protein|nr:GGDEF domain-containing protein [Pyrinomonadaceae bacterium]
MADNSDDTSLVKESGDIDTFSGEYQRRSARRPALVFLRGELLAVPIPLDREQVTLGRALDADIRISDGRASRLHARITTEHDQTSGETKYRLSDLGSTNGTILNGTRIDTAYLEDGDKFEVGEQLIRFEMLDEIDREFQQQIHRLLVHDELTGLLTSKSFFSELRREAARAEAEDMPFCVLMMDIDYFKDVNDTYGHLVGSETLEDVGAIIKKSLRAGDVGARFGGEEFAAFLLDADYSQGLIAAQRVRAAIEKHLFPAVRRDSAEPIKTHHITISIGVASYPEDGRDPIQLVELADSALYRAKRNGRNQVCAYRPAATSEVLRLRPQSKEKPS